MNVITVVGRLTREPDLSYMTSGTAVIKFTIAEDRPLSVSKKKELQENGKQTTDFHNVVFYDKTAETIAQYFHKGDMIIITGRQQHNKYDKDGKTQYFPEITGKEFTFAGHKEVADVKKEDFPEFPNDAYFEPTDQETPF